MEGRDVDGTGMAQGMAQPMKRDSHASTQKISTQLKDIQKTLPLRVLSEADWEHWQTKGYVIVRNAVDQDHVQRLKDLLWQFDEKDPERPVHLVHAAAARPHHEGAQRHRHGGDLQPPVPLG